MIDPDLLTLRSVVERKAPGLPRFAVVPAAQIAPWRSDGAFMVVVRLNGRDIGRRTLKPWGKDRDAWFFDLTAQQCEWAGVDVGDPVSVQLRRADESLPKELAHLIESDSRARVSWESRSAYGRRRLSEHVRAAKRQETRTRRARRGLLDSDRED